MLALFSHQAAQRPCAELYVGVESTRWKNAIIYKVLRYTEILDCAEGAG
jgi:hypothetical protein